MPDRVESRTGQDPSAATVGNASVEWSGRQPRHAPGITRLHRAVLRQSAAAFGIQALRNRERVTGAVSRCAGVRDGCCSLRGTPWTSHLRPGSTSRTSIRNGNITGPATRPASNLSAAEHSLASVQTACPWLTQAGCSRERFPGRRRHGDVRIRNACTRSIKAGRKAAPARLRCESRARGLASTELVVAVARGRRSLLAKSRLPPRRVLSSLSRPAVPWARCRGPWRCRPCPAQRPVLPPRAVAEGRAAGGLIQVPTGSLPRPKRSLQSTAGRSSTASCCWSSGGPTGRRRQVRLRASRPYRGQIRISTALPPRSSVDAPTACT